MSHPLICLLIKEKIFSYFIIIYYTNNIIFCNNNRIYLEFCNYTSIKLNTASENKFAGIYINKSIKINITSNTFDNNLYPIYLHSTNNSYIVNNEGYGNKYNIKEINCKDNYFKDNNFIEGINLRATNEGDEIPKNSKNSTIVDFTLVLLTTGMIICSIFTFQKIFRKK